MRIFEFVPCGRRGALLEDSPPPVATATPSSPAEATPSLPAAEAAVSLSREKRQRRRSCQGSGSAWRPSLVAISEDCALSTTTPAAKKNCGGGGGKAKAKAKVRVLPRMDPDDFRHFGTAVPSFAPMAFMF